MLCDRCQGQEATVHLSTVTHNSQTPQEKHFCPECALIEQVPPPHLDFTTGPPPITSLSNSAKLKLTTVQEKLSELDSIFQNFCTCRGYTLAAPSDLWPSRRARARDEIDRHLHLSPDVSFLQILEKGFYREMPWRLDAKAMPPQVPFPTLTINIFQGTPFSVLPSMLEQRLEEGFSTLRYLTLRDVMTKADAQRAKPSYP
jgi:hypothetical protein